MDTGGKTLLALVGQDAMVDEAAKGVHILVADVPMLQLMPLLENVPKNDDGGSERQDKTASLTRETKKQVAKHLALIIVLVKDFEGMQLEKETQDSLAAVKHISVFLNHPLYCLY